MTFHQFGWPGQIHVVLAEPIPNHYVWLSFYLDRKLRNRMVSKEVAKHLLYRLRGTHHIHWLTELTTFRELARELQWKSAGRSPFFEKCLASVARSLSQPPPCHPLFDVVIGHAITAIQPRLINYKSARDAKRVIALIARHFASRYKRSIPESSIPPRLVRSPNNGQFRRRPKRAKSLAA